MGQLRDRMEQDLILRGLSPSTRKIYLIYARKFAAFHRRPPQEMGEAEIREFLLHLIEVDKVSNETYRQVFAAVKFLYEVTLGRHWEVEHLPSRKRPKRLPVVLSVQEVKVLLTAVRNPMYRALLSCVYAAGLRVIEACRLQVCDVDSARGVLQVRRGKGNKDRQTVLNDELLNILRQYWLIKRPEPWLFPGWGPCGHISDATVRVIFRDAKKQAGIERHATPYALRHSFATHQLEARTNLLLAIQQMLGHCSLKTTGRYAHVSTEHIRKTPSLLAQIGITDLSGCERDDQS